MPVDMALDHTAWSERSETPWAAVTCLSLLTFLLVGLEFMPVSLLTPIARGLAVTEGQAGQAMAVSGFFAVLTSLSATRSWPSSTGGGWFSSTPPCSSLRLATALAPSFAVFLFGRALVGVAVGGFWSLSTAILARLASRSDLPRAITMLQCGSAFALVLAAPLGGLLGSWIGWRGTFLVTVPIGLAALAWQLIAMPSMQATEASSVSRMFGLLRTRTFAIGMAATGLAFIGNNCLSVYFRPFLENITGLHVTALSTMLLGIGLGGLMGLTVVGAVLRRHLAAALIALPSGLAILSVLLIVLGPYVAPTAILLVLWGLFTLPIPVAWNTWMSRVIPRDLEAGGGLQVALIQLAVGGGAYAGGVLFDNVNWWSAFLLGAVLLTGSAVLGAWAGAHSQTTA